MFKDHIERIIQEKFGIEEGHQVLEVKPPHQGDFSSNIAFLKAKKFKVAPEELAKKLSEELKGFTDFTVKEEKGYLNFTFSISFILKSFEKISNKDFGKLGSGSKKILVEYVSANPTGPLNVVQARAGSYGSSLVNLLKFVGHEVESEYYINDAGGQVKLFEESVSARVSQLRGEKVEVPPDGYHGDYIIDIAKNIIKEGIKREFWGKYAVERIIEEQKKSLERLGVQFDNFVRESWIIKEGYVQQVLSFFEKKNLLYKEDGAVYFKSTRFGDDKDRVLIKSSGEPTYFLSDIAYHLHKIERGFDMLVDIWGPDHHGHIKRMEAAMEALGYPGILKVIIVQHLTMKKEGKEVSFSKRKGEFITLDEILSEVGKDATRFFMLMRKESQHLDFDLTLAKKISVENPVYYVQYGHARIKSILRKAEEKGIVPQKPSLEDLKLLSTPEEREVLKKSLYFEDVLRDSASSFEPHRIIYYLLDISRIFHYFYERQRVLTEDERLRNARIFMASQVAEVIKKGLSIIGVEAPEEM